MGESATILRADKDHCCAIWRNIMIFVWRGVTRPETVDEHRKYIEGHIAKGRGPLSLFVITEAQVEIPDGATREKLAALLQAAGPVGRGAALVYEGAGFRGAAIRGVATVLNALARQAFPYKSFGSVEEAASWLTPIHADGKTGTIRPADLVSVIAPLRAVTSMQAAV
jgi:hypothetical protein